MPTADCGGSRSRRRGGTRKDPRPPERLPRTAFGISAVATAAAFTALAAVVTAAAGPTGGDRRLGHDVVAHRRPGLTAVMKVVSDLGTGAVVYPVLLVLGLLLYRRRGDWRPLVVATAALALGQLLRIGISRAVARDRPDPGRWLVHAGGFAFPSGHTATATLGYGLIAALAVRLRPRAGRAIWPAAGTLAVAVGVSRVYLGVHWPTDVLGGWLYGLACLSVLAAADPSRRRRWSGSTTVVPPGSD